MESPKKNLWSRRKDLWIRKKHKVLQRKLEINIWNREDIKQVVRSSSSVAANYIEDNEKLGDNDFLMKLRICIKEIKETILWLRLIDIHSEDLEIERTHWINEAIELKNIVGAIYKNNISKYN